MHDAILTATDKMISPNVEMDVRSITGSSGHGPKSEVQSPVRKYLLENAGNTPLKSASNTSQDRNDETRNEENFEDTDFPAWRPSYDQKAQAHHKTITN